MKTRFPSINEYISFHFLSRTSILYLFLTLCCFFKNEPIYAQCPTIPPIALPFLEDFEDLGDTTLIENGVLCETNRLWEFETAVGFAQFGTGVFVENVDGGALMLFSPGELDPNTVTLTLNMSNYIGATNVVLSFDFFNIGGALSIKDSIWIRGSQTDDWIGVYKWEPHNEQTWLTSPNLNISATLADAGQTFSNSFQIRFGRAGNFGLPSPGAAPELVLDNIRLSACLKPTNLTATNITLTSVTLKWTELSGAMNWNIEYGPKGFTQGTGEEGISFFDNSFELSDLTVNTEYDFYVRSSCEEAFTDWAGPFTFRTLCAPLIPVVLPFLADFEDIGDIGDIVFTANDGICNTNYNWNYKTIGGRVIFGREPFFVANGALSLINSSGFSTNNVTLTVDMSNYIDEDNVFLSFDFYNIESSETLNDSIWIRGSEADAWIAYHNLQEHEVGFWQHFPEVDLVAILSKEAQSFSSTFQIRFGQDKHVSSAFDGFALDNILINNCAKPTDLKATNLTPNSVTLSWETLGTMTNWEFEWGIKGFLQGNGIKMNIDTTSYNLSNLIPATAYDFYVRTDCGELTSKWVGPFTFSTSCPIFNRVSLPFIEDFENIANATLTANGKICKTDSAWEFETNTGQARFGENAPLHNGGTGALLLEGTGSNNTNNAILTLDMSDYIGTTNIILSFDAVDVYDSHSPNDSVWIRGSDTENWVNIYSWQRQEFTWVTSPEFDIITILSAAGQSLSSSFQIRFGQEGRYAYASDGLAIDNITLRDCIKPSDINAKNITVTSADLSWNLLGNSAIWDIEWGIKDFIQGNGILVEGIDTNNYILPSLLPATSFDFYVRSTCNGFFTDWAGPYTFTTLCPNTNPVTLPFIEDFEAIGNFTFLADTELCREHGGWSYKTINGQAQFGINAPQNNGGQGALMLKGGYTNDYTNHAILTIDMSNYESATDLFLVVDFYDARDDSRFDNDKIWIRGNNAEKWLQLYDWQGQAENTWITTPDLNLDTILANAGQKFSNSFQIRFGQQGYYPNFSEGLILDNIYIGECSRPDTLMATNITSTSADLSWAETGTATIWDIEYGLRGYTQGTGTTITGVASNSYTLPNLAEGIYYDFYVRANCGGETSIWAGPYTFNTICSPLNPISLPFVEDFEEVIDTTFIENSFFCSSNGNWEHQAFRERTRFGADATINNGGSGALELSIPSNFGSNNSILTLDMSNYVEATDIILSFDFYNSSNSGTYMDSLWVRGSNADSWVQVYNWAENQEDIWITTPEFDVDNALINAGQSFSNSFQIRFGLGGAYARLNYSLAIDNIYLRTCSRPDSLVVANITPTSADLNWKEMGTATVWDIEWGGKGFLQGDGSKVTGITSNQYALQNLASNTSYDFYVRSNCDGVPSAWIGPLTFSTPCPIFSPISLPFIEDFENITDTTLTENGLICTEYGFWTFETAKGRAKFGTAAPNNNGGSGALLLDGLNDWSISSAILTLDMSYYIGQANIFLTFDYLGRSYSQSNDKIWIRGNDMDNWVEIYDWQEQNFWSNSPELDVAIALTNAGQAFSNRFQIRFGKNGFFPYPDDGLSIDNIIISTCPKPTTLMAINITATSATLAWEEVRNSTSWNIEWDTAGFSQGTGTLINNVDTNVYNLSDLNTGTSYDFYVRSNCDANNPSIWVGPFTFKTIKIYPTNFIENFENYTLDFDWDGRFQIGRLHNNFSNVLFDNLYAGRDLMVTTPLIGEIKKGDWLAFKYQYLNSGSLSPKVLAVGDTLNVQISTDDEASFTTIDQIHADNHDASTGMTQLNYDLSDYSGEIIKVRIFAEWGTGSYYLAMDDFFVGAANLNILDASTMEGTQESTDYLMFPVTLDTTYSNIITVDYTSIDSTATLQGNDYEETSGQLVFLPGETIKEIFVPVMGDDIYEMEEVMKLQLSNPSLARLTDSLGIGFIYDDDFSFIPQANANEDQLNICGTTAQLNAILGEMDAPLGWQIVSGTGGFLEDALLENAMFTGIMGEMYELEWTVNNPFGQAGRDTMVVSFNPDSDNDNIQDCRDRCPDEDDSIDTDGDMQPDACDCNPNDASDSLTIVTNNHPDNRIADSTYQSSVQLRGTGTVKNGSTVIFKAGQVILLSTGFHAEAGSNFYGLIEACDPAENIVAPVSKTINNLKNGVEIATSELLKSSTAIQMQIRPNLIQNEAIIQIDLPNPTKISLSLYNTNGQEVKVYLKNTFWKQGKHLLQFLRGALPAGIYFMQLRSEKGMITKKLLISQ